MHATIYIHPLNEDTWKSLDNKSGWINDLLAEAAPIVSKVLDKPRIEGIQGPKIVPTADAVKGMWPDAPIITAKNKTSRFCKHRAVVGFCKKGCK